MNNLVGMWFSVFAGALLLGCCLIAIIALSKEEENDINYDFLFRDLAEERRENLRNDVLNYFEENKNE